jgi:uncharacterized membrane protein
MKRLLSSDFVLRSCADPMKEKSGRCSGSRSLLKGAFSVLESVGGLLGYFIDQHDLVRLVSRITQEKLTEDPQDFIAQYVVQGAANLSLSSQHFAAAYLLSHGLVKTWLIAGLLREKLWYYPVAIVVFSAFIAYQLFRFRQSFDLAACASCSTRSSLCSRGRIQVPHAAGKSSK